MTPRSWSTSGAGRRLILGDVSDPGRATVSILLLAGMASIPIFAVLIRAHQPVT